MRRTVVLLSAMMLAILSSAAVNSAPAQGKSSSDKSAKSDEVKIAHPEVPRIDAIKVRQWIADKADFVIVDTQSADSYQMWHVPTAINIPYDSIANPADRAMMLSALPMDKTIVIYCLCEEGTDSARMALELKRLGYDHDKVKVLEGGLIKWDENGYPMIKTEVPE